MIRSATYPKGFRIDKTIKPYDGTAKPATWLQDHGNAVEIAGGNPNIAVKYLPLMLAGMAVNGLMTCRKDPSAIGWTCKKRSPRTSRARTNVPALLAIYSGACRRKTRNLAPTSPAGWI